MVSGRNGLISQYQYQPECLKKINLEDTSNDMQILKFNNKEYYIPKPQ